VRTIWICSPDTYVSVVYSTWSSWTMWLTHAPTFGKWWKKKVTLHMLTHGTMRGCGLTSLVVCINDRFRDIRERNVTIRSEIWTTNICSLGFWDIRECVTLWRLILQKLGCTHYLRFCIRYVQTRFKFLHWIDGRHARMQYFLPIHKISECCSYGWSLV
jgi:hypothetical protein